MENYDRPENLFERYLENRCTSEELKILLEYFDKTEHRELFTKLINQNLDKEVYPDAEESFFVQMAVKEVQQSIRARIGEERKEGMKKFKMPLWMRIAAVWIILLGAFGVLLYYPLESSGPPIVPLQQLITERGQRAKIKLPDGTRIWLSPLSKLEYPEKFKGRIREINLTGEAFFEVAKDKEHPFVIHSGALNTEVLGTSFNIRSYNEQESAVVTVLTGKVGVSAHSARHPGKVLGQVYLLPDQRVVFNKKQHVLKKENYPKASKLLDEREGNFVFEGMPVPAVLEEAQRQYNMNIRVNGNIDHCKFYGDLKASESITTFLKKLCMVIHAKWHKDKDSYVIVAPGC